MINKIDELQAFLKKELPFIQTQISIHPEGGFVLMGEFPSFGITLGCKDNPDGYIVSVNADAPFIAKFASLMEHDYPEIAFQGAYCERVDGKGLLFGDEAYKEREQHIMMQSLMIAKKREEEQPKEEQSKLIVPSSGLKVVK